MGADRQGSGHLAADLGQLARSVADEVGEQVPVVLAHVLAVVLELLDGVEHLLTLGFRLVHDARALVLGIFDGGRCLGIRVRDDLVCGTLRDDESLRDGVVVGLLGLELALQIGDARVLLGQRGIVRHDDGSFDASRRVEAFELTIVQLVLELGDLGVHAVDLVGDMLEEHIDFVDVVAFAIDREALVVYLSRGDSHL